MLLIGYFTAEMEAKTVRRNVLVSLIVIAMVQFFWNPVTALEAVPKRVIRRATERRGERDAIGWRLLMPITDDVYSNGTGNDDYHCAVVDAELHAITV